MFRKIGVLNHFGKFSGKYQNTSARVYFLILFRMGLFGAAHRWGEAGGGSKKRPLRKICLKYPAMMKLGAVTAYLRTI